MLGGRCKQLEYQSELHHFSVQKQARSCPPEDSLACWGDWAQLQLLLACWPPWSGSPLVSAYLAQLVSAQRKTSTGGFPGGAVVENPPANAGHTGSCPVPGGSHMPQSN